MSCNNCLTQTPHSHSLLWNRLKRTKGSHYFSQDLFLQRKKKKSVKTALEILNYSFPGSICTLLASQTKWLLLHDSRVNEIAIWFSASQLVIVYCQTRLGDAHFLTPYTPNRKRINLKTGVLMG